MRCLHQSLQVFLLCSALYECSHSADTCEYDKKLNLGLDRVKNDEQILKSMTGLSAADEDMCLQLCCTYKKSEGGNIYATFGPGSGGIECQCVRCDKEAHCYWGPSPGAISAKVTTQDGGEDSNDVETLNKELLEKITAQSTASSHIDATTVAMTTEQTTTVNTENVSSDTPITDEKKKHHNKTQDNGHLAPLGNITYKNGETFVETENGTTVLGPALTIPNQTEPTPTNTTSDDQSILDKIWEDLFADDTGNKTTWDSFDNNTTDIDSDWGNLDNTDKTWNSEPNQDNQWPDVHDWDSTQDANNTTLASSKGSKKPEQATDSTGGVPKQFGSVNGTPIHAIAIGIVMSLMILFMIISFTCKQVRKSKDKKGKYSMLHDDGQYDDAREPLYQ